MEEKIKTYQISLKASKKMGHIILWIGVPLFTVLPIIGGLICLIIGSINGKLGEYFAGSIGEIVSFFFGFFVINFIIWFFGLYLIPKRYSSFRSDVYPDYFKISTKTSIFTIYKDEIKKVKYSKVGSLYSLSVNSYMGTALLITTDKQEVKDFIYTSLIQDKLSIRDKERIDK